MIPSKEAAEGELEAVHRHVMKEGIDKSATVVVALTQGWPRGLHGMWTLAVQASADLEPGAVVIVTSAWPGCRRGLFEVFSYDLSSQSDSRIRFPMSGSAAVSLVTPQVDKTNLFERG